MAAARNSCTGNRGKTVEKVAAVKCSTYEPEKVYEAIKEALSINCYHCLFACPHDAIGIVSSPMNKLIRVIRYIIGI